MRKNIHKKIRNTPDTKTRRAKPQETKKSPSQKPKPKIRCTVTQMNFI